MQDQAARRDGWGRRPAIYQLVVRHFGNENLTRLRDGTIEQNGVGTFADINEAALAMIAAGGFTHVWLTGVLRQATLTDWSSVDPALGPDPACVVKGRAGSFYAVRDGFDVCPDYALDPARRLDEFDALVQRIHRAGLKVLLDLVPNHVARGYRGVVRPDLDFGLGDDTSAFFSPRNSFFYLPAGEPLRLSKPARWAPEGVVFDEGYQREDGSPGRPARVTGNNVRSARPSADDWYETVKLNYGHNFADPASSSYEPRPPTWDIIDAMLAHWQRRGVDGFRCDFAHYVPDEAWRWLLARARERDPGALLVAEAYDNLHGLLDAGFDAVYDDATYDALRLLYQGRHDLDRLDAALRDLGGGRRHRFVHYLENHDERRIASPIVLDAGPDDSGFGSARAGRQLAPLLYLASSGPLLFYNGQEVGEDGSGDEGFGGEDGRTSLFDYWGLPSLAALCNGKRWDGGKLDPEQASLRAFYRDLLPLCQHEAARAPGFWGLRYANPHAPSLLPFARFAPRSGALLLVVANFAPGAATRGRIKLPQPLLDAAGLSSGGSLRQLLDERGGCDRAAGWREARSLSAEGVEVSIADQATHVFELTTP